MWSSRLFWKLFLVYMGLNLALAIGFVAVVVVFQQSEVHRQVQRRLFNTAVMLRSQTSPLMDQIVGPQAIVGEPRAMVLNELQELLVDLAAETDTRMTIADGDGTVLADSEQDPATMLDRANRPELRDAADYGKGIASRASLVSGVKTTYFALRVDVGDNHAFIRVAEPMRLASGRVGGTETALIVFLGLFAIVATLLIYMIVGRIIDPLSQLTDRAQAIASGHDRAPLSVRSEDEVGVLADAFNKMQAQLAKRFRQLENSRDQVSTVLGSMDEGIIAVDHSENIVFINDASRRMLNMSADDYGGRPLLEIVRARSLHEVVRQCLDTGNSVRAEFESLGNIRRDLIVRASRFPGNPAPGVVIVMHDITELRRLENLRHEFVANVSHELKTPLAAIKAYAETLRMGALEDSQNNERFVIQIEEQADRLHQLIMDMLQIARVESGEEAFEIVEVSIQQIADQCIGQYAQAADRKSIRLVTERPEEDVVVMADEDGLQAIMDNLLSNAIKYTPESGTVTISWRQLDQFALLEVKDTGIGIPEKHHDRIFERFYRVDKARSRELGGTGLGLSIVKHLCQSFDGSVTLKSTPGEGTSFLVRLPCKSISPQQDVPVVQP